MDKPIAVGDLVMVVRPGKHHCPKGRTFKRGSFGLPFVVAAVDFHEGKCRRCGAGFGIHWYAKYVGPLGDRYIAFRRLRKIDPPVEPERVTRDEEVTA